MAVLKNSRQRESIKRFLCSREDHPTADTVYRNIREEFPRVSLGTVYRNLSLLVELGEIQRIRTDGADRFDARMSPHSHFICRGCGCVTDILLPFEDLVPVVNQSQDFGEADECRIEFYGRCSQCKNLKNRSL